MSFLSPEPSPYAPWGLPEADEVPEIAREAPPSRPPPAIDGLLLYSDPAPQTRIGVIDKFDGQVFYVRWPWLTPLH